MLQSKPARQLGRSAPKRRPSWEGNAKDAPLARLSSPRSELALRGAPRRQFRPKRRPLPRQVCDDSAPEPVLATPVRHHLQCAKELWRRESECLGHYQKVAGEGLTV